jgi:hypothetical protein
MTGALVSGAVLEITTVLDGSSRPDSRPSKGVARALTESNRSKFAPVMLLLVAPVMGLPPRYHCQDTVMDCPSTSAVPE